MITTPDGINLYTEEDYNTVSNQQFNVGVEYGKNATSNNLRERALEWFKSEAESSMTKEDALSIFNGLADALGWETVNSITSVYRVTISFQGACVGEFDLEAEDEDSAIEDVRDNLELVEAELSLSLSYNSDSSHETVDMSYDFDMDDLRFSAEEL